VKVELQDYILDVLINCTRKTSLLSLQPWKLKQGCQHGFARDENPLSTTYALDCAVESFLFLYYDNVGYSLGKKKGIERRNQCQFPFKKEPTCTRAKHTTEPRMTLPLIERSVTPAGNRSTLPENLSLLSDRELANSYTCDRQPTT